MRSKYSSVDEGVYRVNRQKTLLYVEKMAQSGELYPERYFSELYRLKAIDNIAREVARLDESGVLHREQ